jgi:signal transduction histidine kinase
MELRQIFDELDEAVKMAKDLNIQLNQLFRGTTQVRETVSLDRLLEDATRLGLFGAVGVECRFKLSPQLPPVRVDRCQITQVIENLVLNAVQAMPNGGQLEVATEVVELAEGQLPPLRAGKYVEIRVSDTGVGICAEHLSVIFAPHFTTKAQGQGLGLALCYTIIQRHQGHIRVESQPGAGTTFRVWLPLNSTEL